jgi:phosphate starvation-inducible PhoH-like protein
MTESPAEERSADQQWTAVLELDSPRSAEALLGQRNENLARLERTLGVRIHSRDRRLTVEAESEAQLDLARNTVAQLYELADSGYSLGGADVERAARMLMRKPDTRLADVLLDTVLTTDRGRAIAPKSLAQKFYVDSIRHHDIVFGVGPAGTGKTYLAMAMALEALLKKRVRRIILTRPAVEAGEKLGFLPGDLAEKVNPYLRPLNDALQDMMAPERAHKLLERGEIEVAPLAFMRGRTLNDSFVILDEAQNATREQMKMVLTRLGFSTKAVVTGDVTQIDLPDYRRSGLAHATRILEDIEGIRICRFTEIDVVRHPLVMEIIKAYERHRERDE